MTTDLLDTLLETFGPVRVRFDEDDAAEFPWVFEPYGALDFDLDIEKATVRSLDGKLDMEFNATVLDRRRENQPVGAFQRVIRGDTAWHKSSLTFEPFQRQGISRRLLAASIALYDSLAVTLVRMNATGVGRYAWARAGFDFDEHVFGDDAAEAPAVATFRDWAERLGHDLGDAKRAWEIAGRREEVPPGLFEERGGNGRFLGSPADSEGPLGRVLLLATGVWHWDATLDLRPGSPGRARFEEYCRP